MQVTAAGIAVIVGSCLAAALGGCDPAGLDAKRSAMVKTAKAAGLIDTRLRADCTRIEADSSWAAIDEPLWNRNDKRCSKYSHKAMIVFHHVAGRWQVVTVRKEFGHSGSCRVQGVPAAVSRRLPLC